MRQSPATCDRAANGHYQQRTALVVTPELSKKKKILFRDGHMYVAKKKKKETKLFPIAIQENASGSLLS